MLLYFIRFALYFSVFSRRGGRWQIDYQSIISHFIFYGSLISHFIFLWVINQSILSHFIIFMGHLSVDNQSLHHLCIVHLSVISRSIRRAEIILEHLIILGKYSNASNNPKHVCSYNFELALLVCVGASTAFMGIFYLPSPPITFSGIESSHIYSWSQIIPQTSSREYFMRKSLLHRMAISNWSNERIIPQTYCFIIFLFVSLEKLCIFFFRTKTMAEMWHLVILWYVVFYLKELYKTCECDNIFQ